MINDQIEIVFDKVVVGGMELVEFKRATGILPRAKLPTEYTSSDIWMEGFADNVEMCITEENAEHIAQLTERGYLFLKPGSLMTPEAHDKLIERMRICCARLGMFNEIIQQKKQRHADWSGTIIDTM